MKANAPDKIYLEAIYPDNGVLPNGLNYTPSPKDIEYTRTDAFIEKACSWLENNLQGIVGGSIYIEDFRKYIEGE